MYFPEKNARFFRAIRHAPAIDKPFRFCYTVHMIQDPVFADIKLCKPGSVERYDSATPWKDSDVSFHLDNCAFPSPHKHEYYEILIAEGDTIEHEIFGKRYPMKKGDAWLIRPTDEHSLHNDEKLTKNYRLIVFLARTDFFRTVLRLIDEKMPEYIDGCEKPLRFALDNISLSKLYNDCIQLQTLQTISKNDKKIRCKFLLFDLLSLLFRQTVCEREEYPEWFADFLGKLHDMDFCCRPLTEICANISYSYSYFSRVFKKYTGVSLLQYITKVKIDYAIELLCHTDMTTLEISGRLNYESLSHFNHTFKNVTGISPREYKKQFSDS